MSQKLNKSVYSIFIFRTDGQHLEVYSSNNFDACFQRWEQLTTEWTSAVKEERPFILRDPIVTAFSPNLIFELKLLPVSSQEMAAKSHNPYNQKMYEEGFGKVFPSQGRDLLG